MAKEEEKKQKEPQALFVVGEIPTETKPVIANTQTNEQYDIYLAIAKIMNDVEEIKNNIVAGE